MAAGSKLSAAISAVPVYHELESTHFISVYAYNINLLLTV
jgi:hypothetical protein